MEFHVSLCRGLSLNLVYSPFTSPLSFSHHKAFRDKFLVSGFCFSHCRRKQRNPFRRIKFCSVETPLRPPPRPEPPKIKVNGSREVLEEKTQMKKPGSGLCDRIEKLVLRGKNLEALELFDMLEIAGDCDVGSETYDALVKACIGSKSVTGAKRVFNHMLSSGFEPDLYMSNRVLFMFLKCGMTVDAQKLFDEMPERNLTSWNMLISGLVDNGKCGRAFQRFLTMWEEFSDFTLLEFYISGSRTLATMVRTFATMIRASASLASMFEGRQLHSCALKMGFSENVYVSCALIDMYCKCGSIGDAQCVFDEMPEKTTVAWNTIIAGYLLHGLSEEALSIYYQMCDSGAKMDNFTLCTVVGVCARLASLELAKQAHAGLIRHGCGLNQVASLALVDFYGKWGRMEDAQHVFDTMPDKNVDAWNALIAGYAHHGQGTKAVEMFEQMLLEGIRPDHITFLAVLSGCSHSGLSEDGREIFESMNRLHNNKRREKHYACMIELLGREGRLDQAFEMIMNAPFEPTENMWAALLTACRVHKNLGLGEFAAVELYELGPTKLSNYVTLLNIYNSSGRLEEASSVLQTLQRKGFSLLPACSWIEIRKQAHTFHSGDESHVQTKEIYQKLAELYQEIEKHGYVPEKKFVLPDVDKHEMDAVLSHSEKLAVGFGLVNTSHGTSLRIVQSHRICDDCHNAMKLIALVTNREILMRDASRFHHFRDGSCSCSDYW